MSTELAPEDIYNVVVGTAGHIDHGKSSIVRRLTGIDPDRLPEEQQRGMTIDLGFAPFRLRTGQTVGLIDVPGHERFIKNMVAGATGMDLVMLVVAADDGIMPQTREHLEIMTLLGLRRGFVVINKIDLVEPDLAELVEEEVRGLVAGTFLEGAPIVRVSAATGEGFETLVETLNRLVLETPPRTVEGYFRMPIQRVFSAKGFGTVVTGVPLSGRARAGDIIEILPAGRRGRIRNLQAYKHAVSEVRAGHSSALNVADIPHAQVQRGDVAAAPDIFRPATMFEALLTYLPRQPRPLRHMMPVRLHVGTKEAIGRIVLLDARELEPGATGLVQLRIEEPVVVAPGDPFILRLQSPLVTLGGGRVLEVSDRRARRFHAPLLDRLGRVRAALDDPRARTALAMETLPDFATVEEIARTALVLPDVARGVVQDLLERNSALERDGRYLHGAAFESALANLVEQVERYHARHPVRAGIPKAILRQESGVSDELFAALVEAAIERRELVIENERVRRPHHEPTLSREDRQALDALEERIRAGRFATPNEQELCAAFDLPPERLRRLLELLVDRGAVLALKDGVYIHVDAMRDARDIVVGEIRRAGALEPGRAKDVLGTTRKYAIPILEHLDEIGVTRRQGNARVLREGA